VNASGTAERQPQILVVDDERDNRELLDVLLSWEGFIVLTAEDGEQALAIVTQQRPDLVLLDVMMPGMTGYEVVAKMKLDIATRHIPVIMITAMHDPRARTLALNAGADDFMVKPLGRSELLLRVRTALKGAAGATDPAFTSPSAEREDA
jgi:diguanylate cyclase